MAVDPFDLGTWYQVKGDRDRDHMTGDELAAKLCQSSVALEKAKRRLKACETIAAEKALEHKRCGATLHQMIQTLASKPDEVTQRAAPLAAVKFAEAAVAYRLSETALRAAEAETGALDGEVKEGIEALIVACEPAS